MVDGSPLFFQQLYKAMSPIETPKEFLQNEILKSLIHIDYPESSEEIYKTALTGDSFEKKLESFINFSQSDKRSTKKHSKASIQSLFNRLSITGSLDLDSFPVLKSAKMTLFVPTESFVKDLPTDYDLSRYSSQKVETMTVKGNHVTILKNPDLCSHLISLN